MSRRRIEDRAIRKLSRVGGGKTYSLTIPIEIIRKFGWKEGQRLVVGKYRKEKRIIMGDWKK